MGNANIPVFLIPSSCKDHPDENNRLPSGRTKRDAFPERDGRQGAEQDDTLDPVFFYGRLVDNPPVEPQLPDDICKIIEFHRFYDEAVHAEVITLHDIPLFTGGGQDHDGNAPGLRVTLQPFEDLDTIDPGELQIEEDDRGFVVDISSPVGACAKNVIESLFAIPCDMDSVRKVAPLEDMEDELDIIGVVFDDEYLCRFSSILH